MKARIVMTIHCGSCGKNISKKSMYCNPCDIQHDEVESMFS